MNRNAERDADLKKTERLVKNTPVKRYMLIRVRVKVIDVDFTAIILDMTTGSHISK